MLLHWKIFTLFTLLFGLVVADACAASENMPSRDCVILIHGAGRTHVSMIPLELYLRAHGYRVINARFDSAGRSIEEIAEDYFPKTLSSLTPGTKVHFVAHSMGAIILRQYLASHVVTNLGRVVMLGPPNHGSEIIDQAERIPVLRALLGRRLRELGTGSNSLPNCLGPATFNCGVIAGNVCANPVTGFMLRSPNDGKVTVESARLDGMKDLLVVRHSHTWMIWNCSVMRHVCHFLQQGKFDDNHYKPEVSGP